MRGVLPKGTRREVSAGTCFPPGVNYARLEGAERASDPEVEHKGLWRPLLKGHEFACYPHR